MKKILIIAYYFPPLGGMGAIRPLKLGKYLSRKGFEITVLAPEKGTSEITDDSLPIPIELKIVRSSAFTDRIRHILGRERRKDLDPGVSQDLRNADLRRPRGTAKEFLRGLVVNWLLIPDGKAGWIPSAYSLGKKLVKRENVDLIFSTSSPFTDHMIAYFLKRKLGKPWVADFRDLWAMGEYLGKPRIRQMIDKRLEREVIRFADAVTVVSDEHRDKLIEAHPGFREKIWTVPNAFDPEDLEGMSSRKTSEFTLLHTGTVYGEDTNFEVLFLALRELMESGKIDRPRIRVSFLGLPNRFIINLTSELRMDQVVKYEGLVKRKDALRAQAQATVLFLSLKGGEDPALRGVVGAKLYEYLFSGTPILAMCDPESAPGRIIGKTGAGKVVKPGDREGLKEVLLSWYREFLDKGEIFYTIRKNELKEFHFSKSAEKLEDVIRKVVLNRAKSSR